MGVMLDSAIDCHVGGRDEYIGTKQRERARGLGMPGIRQRHAVGGWRVPACDARRRLLIVSTAGDAAGSERPSRLRRPVVSPSVKHVFPAAIHCPQSALVRTLYAESFRR